MVDSKDKIIFNEATMYLQGQTQDFRKGGKKI